MVKVYKLLFFLGCMCIVLGGGLLIQREVSGPVSFLNLSSTNLSPSQESITEINRIEIPSLGINLPIETHEINNNNWPVSTTGVVRIKNTNILYGHNWPKLLGNLGQLRSDEEVIVNGKVFKVVKRVVVFPHQSDVLKEADSDHVIVYTCTGPFDIKRLVVVAKVLQ